MYFCHVPFSYCMVYTIHFWYIAVFCFPRLLHITLFNMRYSNFNNFLCYIKWYITSKKPLGGS